MESKEIFDVLSKSEFNWGKLNRIYGSAHNSIIGFLSFAWISLSDKHSVLDGAPSPKTGKGRKGQYNADLLLCVDSKPFIPVEVETTVKNYENKLKSLNDYSDSFKYENIGFELLYLGNGGKNNKHNWDDIKKIIISSPTQNSIALISAVKRKTLIQNISEGNSLLARNEYYPWEIINIDCWICDRKKVIIERNLWANP